VRPRARSPILHPCHGSRSRRWLGSYADAVLEDSTSTLPSPLTEWATSIGIHHPGDPSTSGLLGETLPKGVPDATLGEFAELGPQLAMWPEHLALGKFVRELVRAAKKREAPRPTESQREYVYTRLSLDHAKFVSTSAGWALDFPNLYSRIWFELFELFEARPRLHLCPLCQRVYVPRTSAQTRCRRTLYTWPGGVEIRACVPQPQLAADEHRRKYKRLMEARRRARRRHGDSSPEAHSAHAALEAYLHDPKYKGRRVGRPPKDKPVTLLT